MLTLEKLEDRNAPSPFVVTEIAAPPNMTNVLTATVDTGTLLFLGQFPQLHIGIPYLGPDQVIRYDLPPQQFALITGFPPEDTARDVLPTLFGEIPVVLIPSTVAAPGANSGLEQWELWALQTGFSGDGGDFPMPPFQPPNFPVADLAFLSGASPWSFLLT